MIMMCNGMVAIPHSLYHMLGVIHRKLEMQYDNLVEAWVNAGDGLQTDTESVDVLAEIGEFLPPPAAVKRGGRTKIVKRTCMSASLSLSRSLSLSFNKDECNV
jgi:hypothetical protein